jgi:hypothetical protein
MHFAFEIRAATRAKAKQAVELQLQAAGVSPEDAQRALTMASGFIDSLDAGEDQQYLVVLNGSDRAENGTRTEMSIGYSVYVVPKGDEPQEPDLQAETRLAEPEPEAAAPVDGEQPQA